MGDFTRGADNLRETASGLKQAGAEVLADLRQWEQAGKRAQASFASQHARASTALAQINEKFAGDIEAELSDANRQYREGMEQLTAIISGMSRAIQACIEYAADRLTQKAADAEEFSRRG